jgi:hypothetical protein
MEHHEDIVDYLNRKGAMVILLFRRNTLRRLISVLANNYDRRTKQLNAIHKSRVHSKEEVHSSSTCSRCYILLKKFILMKFLFFLKKLRIWIGLLIRNMTSSTKTISQFQHESRSNRQFSNENIVLEKDGSVTFPSAG